MSIEVFLADDHKLMREGLRILLQMQPDIKVTGEAADGRAAARLASQHCPDVAIMDIAMPHLNGIDATRNIRTVCPSTEVIILSMYSTSEHVFRALEAGARGYVMKESAGKEIIAAVRAVAHKRYYLCGNLPKHLLSDYERRLRVHKQGTPLQNLSPREREIVQLVVEGESSAEIGRILELSRKTIETYRSRIMAKLDVKNVADLVKFAIQHGLTPLK
jgi:DNA-binding NarL/FixJ family response regulator